MDFFEEQDLARRRTFRLGLLFAFAVVGVSAAVYALGLGVYYWIGVDAAGVNYMTGRYDSLGQAEWSLWNPMVFAASVGSTLLLIALGSLYKTAQLRSGGAAVARALGGRRVDPDSTKLDERRLLNVVEEMSIASGVPVPDVYVLDDESGINAFAAGNTTSDAVIGVTQGTLQLLRRSELQGVVGARVQPHPQRGFATQRPRDRPASRDLLARARGASDAARVSRVPARGSEPCCSGVGAPRHRFDRRALRSDDPERHLSTTRTPG